MRFTITDKEKAECFCTIFKHIKNFTDHITFQFEDDMLYVQGMDSCQVSLYEIKFSKSWFSEYDSVVPSNEPTATKEVSINAIFLGSILGIRQDNQTIIIDYGNDKLNFEYTSDATNEFDKYFELPTMELNKDILEIPESEYVADFEIETKVFSVMMDQLKIFDERMDIECSESDIIIEATGVEGKMKINIPIDDILEYSIEEDATLKQSYSLNFVSKMCDFAKISKEVYISISDEVPMQIRYPLSDESYVRFFLAPTITED